MNHDMDATHWDAVQEVSELLAEEQYLPALCALHPILKEDPRNPYAYFFLGIAFFEIGELEKSRDAYRACVKLAPNHAGARTALSHVLRMLGDTRDAIQEAKHVLSQLPGDGDALYALGLAHHARGDYSDVRTYLNDFLKTKHEMEIDFEVREILAAIEQEEHENMGSFSEKP